jgi:hypothetical protein
VGFLRLIGLQSWARPFHVCAVAALPTFNNTGIYEKKSNFILNRFFISTYKSLNRKADRYFPAAIFFTGMYKR